MSRKTSKPDARVIYARNIDQVDMRQVDLMTDTLPTNYLYSKIAVGKQAASFFTETMLGADFDVRLRQKFQAGFEKLLKASPQNPGEIAEAQIACMTVIEVYNTIAAQIEEKDSSEQQLINAQLEEEE